MSGMDARTAATAGGQPGATAGGQPAAAAGQPLTATADERRPSFRPVICDRCLAEVLVAKFSPQHTSVQWSPEAVRTCAEFTARSAAGEQTARINSCASLRAAIDQAVLEGRVEVAPP
jgi:hypothetical protein